MSCTKFMRPLLLLFLLTLSLTNCNLSTEKDCNVIKTDFYETGKLKRILSLNPKGFKNGESFYFNEYGFLDSSVTFRNDILDGIKKIFYDAEIYTYQYDKGNLLSHSVYDSLNMLLYKTPLDINKVGKTQIKFFSNRNYIDQSKIDTFTITNEGLPPYNRRLEVSGAIIEHLHDKTFTIRTSKHFADLKQIFLKVFARQNVSDTTEKGIVIDSLIIPAK